MMHVFICAFMGKSEKSHVSQKKRGWEKTNIVNLVRKILVTNRDASHKSKIPMSTLLERENGGKLIYRSYFPRKTESR